MRRTTIYFLLCFLSFACGSSNDIRVSLSAFDAVSGDSREYGSFWRAMENFDFDLSRYPQANDEMRLFAQANRLFQSGKIEQATAQLIAVHDASSDSLLRKAAAKVAGSWLLLQYRWQEMVEFDKRSGFLSEDADSTGLVVRAYAETEKERLRFTENQMTVPVKLGLAGVPQVEVEINGQKHKFWVDTGAGATVLASDFAEKLGIEPIGEAQAAVGTVTDIKVGMQPIRIERLKVANVEVENHPAIIIAKEDLEFKVLGFITLIKIDGILGWPLLQQLDFELDYAGETMTIRKPRPRAAVERNLTWADIPILQVQTTSGPLYFGLDTGAGVTGLSDHILSKIDTAGLGKREMKIQGAGGAQKIIASVVPNFEFYLSGYSFNFKEVVAVAQNRDIFFRLDGMMGGDIFKNGKVRIDFTNGRLDVSLPATALLAQK